MIKDIRLPLENVNNNAINITKDIVNNNNLFNFVLFTIFLKNESSNRIKETMVTVPVANGSPWNPIHE